MCDKDVFEPVQWRYALPATLIAAAVLLSLWEQAAVMGAVWS